MSKAYLSLGSNLGDRLSNIQQAVRLLTSDNNIKLLRASSFYETQPWGLSAQNWFINAAIAIETELSPIELLRVCQNIESQLGRIREGKPKWSERVIDIDILFYDDLVFKNEILEIFKTIKKEYKKLDNLINNAGIIATNLAMISGKLAAETAVEALDNNDFSKKMLSNYEKKLKESFIIKDMRTYKDLMDVMHSRKSAFLSYYFKKINSFFEMFTSANSVPKKTNFCNFIKSIFTDRSIVELFKDCTAVIKLLWSILA